MATITRLSEDALIAALPAIPSWSRNGDQIERNFEFSNFVNAFGFLTQVAIIAERADHHPEIFNVWNRVKLVLTTHDANGLTEKDMALAKEIDALL